MEKGWPPLKECIQYKTDMITAFLQKFSFEDEERDDEREYIYKREYLLDEEDSPLVKVTYKPSSLRKFLHVVRTSRGYDIDQGLPVPGFMSCPFSLYTEDEIIKFGKYVKAAVDLSIKEINSNTGRTYKRVEILKVVDTPHNVLLLTFTAAAKFTKKMKKTGKKEKKAKVKREHTFLAAVSTPGPAPAEFKVLECFRKPKDPAPWTYVELKCCERKIEYILPSLVIATARLSPSPADRPSPSRRPLPPPRSFQDT